AAREKAIKYLKDQQKPDGTWEGIIENILSGMEGGVTALVTVSLLEAGVPADDPAVVKAVAYLAQLPPMKTKAVCLQTRVRARVDVKKHATVIQANADWLARKAIRNIATLEGWSYPGNNIPDGANTHFAVLGLDAAAGAGAKVDPKLWIEIRELYTRT